MTSDRLAPAAGRITGLTDLHSHVLPGVDDGAQDLDEALSGLRALRAEGVARVVATPHFRASLLEMPSREAEHIERFDRAYQRLTEAAAEAQVGIEIERACEFRLDAPGIDLSDPRLRLAGSRYALVEFGSFQLPPFGGNQLAAVREAGWSPLLAHPERYIGVSGALQDVEQWVREGVLLQVNARSLFGRYGPEAQNVSRELLRRGWVCCLASDYHARGAPDLRAAVELLLSGSVVAGQAQPDPGQSAALEAAVRRLVIGNPTCLLADQPPQLVPPLQVPETAPRSRRGRWFG